MTIFLVISIGVAPLLVGALLLVRGMRGKRVDDHPVCRKCGFDLSGKPQDQTVCSECGNPLAQRGAVRIGNRVRSPGLIFFAAMLLVFGLGIGGAIGWSLVAGPQFDQHKPAWWLRAELSYAGPDLQARALSQFNTRLALSQLTAAQVQSVADRALVVQADARLAWLPAWGDFVERAHATGQLSDAQWERYVRQAAASSKTLKVRPRVRRSDRIPIELHDAPSRVGNNCQLMAVARQVVTIDGVPLDGDRDAGGWQLQPRNIGSWSTTSVTIPEALRGRFRDGPHTLGIEYALAICTSFQTRDTPVARTTMRLEAPFELLPDGAATVTLHGASSYGEALRQSITAARRSNSPDGKDGKVAFSVDIRKLPGVGVGFRVFARAANGVEEEIGTFAWRNPKVGRGTFFTSNFEPHEGPFDIILRADRAAAMETVDVTEIWDGQLVYEDVPLKEKH